ncbi:hypothetical protein HY450_01535 [Candidatus Pacearchaeota archaeon]|nr:hypothetical protein [Candidatus Pacearchaeota archaeon]
MIVKAKENILIEDDNIKVVYNVVLTLKNHLGENTPITALNSFSERETKVQGIHAIKKNGHDYIQQTNKVFRFFVAPLSSKPTEELSWFTIVVSEWYRSPHKDRGHFFIAEVYDVNPGNGSDPDLVVRDLQNIIDGVVLKHKKLEVIR